MAKRRKRVSREAPRQGEIIREIRNWIVKDGRYGPGDKLPTQSELMKTFDAGTSTVQMALKQLTVEGFIEGRQPLGTFVSDAPPHLNQFALVIPKDPRSPAASREWSRYYQALSLAANRLEAESGYRLLQFYGIDWHEETPDRQRLQNHVECDSLAGIIFANIPFLYENTPLLDRPGIPRVAMSAGCDYPNVCAINFGSQTENWQSKALDHLAEQRCTKVALITYSLDSKRDDAFAAILNERGLESCSRWRLAGSLQSPEGVSHLAELLMHDQERPDALLIDDDNFVEPVIAGLIRAGVRVPEDLVVVGHANFPLPPAAALPVRLLGNDLSKALETSVRIILDWRHGKMPETETLLAPVWRDDYED